MSRLANGSEPQQDLDILQLLTRAKGSWISDRHLKCEINEVANRFIFQLWRSEKGNKKKKTCSRVTLRWRPLVDYLVLTSAHKLFFPALRKTLFASEIIPGFHCETVAFWFMTQSRYVNKTNQMKEKKLGLG